MEAETYPDVTLANNSVAEQRAPLNSPHTGNNDGATGKDTFVILQSKRKRNQISRKQIFVISVIVILILVVAISITVIVTKQTCEKCSDCKSSQHSDSGSLISEQPHKNPGDSDDEAPSDIPETIGQPGDKKNYPWSGIRLPRSVLPSLYEIRLKIDLSKFFYEGAVNITIKVNAATKYIVFHRAKIAITKSSVSISSMYSPDRHIVQQFEVKKRHFHVIELDEEIEAGNTYVLTIGEYSGMLLNDLQGLYLSSYQNKDGETRYLAASQLQAIDARKVFPCFDEPDMKARFKLSIIYQKEFTAITNMPAMSTTKLDNEWMRKDYETTPVMSTYLLAVTVCDFKSRNYTFENGYELRMWARPDAFSQTEHALEFAVEAYEFFTDYFGMPDVVPKADHVAIPDFNSGAMENWGLVIYRETSMLYDQHVSSSRNKYTVTLIVAHEIAHTWFGNMVTMAWWDDLALNEGFASLLMYIVMDKVYPEWNVPWCLYLCETTFTKYATTHWAYFIMDKVYPEWNVFAMQVVNGLIPVMVEDALPTSHPVSWEMLDPEDIPQNFDSISYNKAMAVLRMLMEFFGRINFRNALRLYIEKYRFKNAAMGQLWQTFTESLNYTYDVAEIMDTWTLQMGYPLVTLEENGGQYILKQERFLLDNTLGSGEEEKHNPLGYKWYIPFTYVTQEAPESKKLVWLNLGSVSIPKPSNSWLLGNYEFTGYYRVMYDKNMWGMLAEQLMKNHTVFPEANRAGLVSDAFIFARANLLDYDVTLNLTRYLKKEQSHIPWQSFLHSMEFLKGMIANKAAYVQLQDYLQKLVAPVFDVVRASDSGKLPERYLRRIILHMACDVGVEKAVAYAKSMFANWMKHGTRLPPDLSSLIYSVGIREGGSAEWDYLWNKTRSTVVATEMDMMMESLVYTQKPWLLWRYINWLFDPEKIRPQDVRLVFGYFSNTPLARMVALQFVMSRWDDLVTAFGDNSYILRDIIHKVTLYVNSEFHLKQFEDLFLSRPPREATNAIDNALALIKTNIVWMKNNYDRITDWLEHNEP